MPLGIFQSRQKNLPDIQKNFLYEVYIPPVADLVTEDMLLRNVVANLPGRTIQKIESFFMGSKQQFAGRSEFNNEVTLEFSEREDQKVLKQFDSWFQAIYNYDPRSPLAGTAAGDSKLDYVVDVTIRMYKSNGDKLDKDVVLFNCWPSALAEVPLDYAGNDFVRPSVTLTYDYYLLK